MDDAARYSTKGMSQQDMVSDLLQSQSNTMTASDEIRHLSDNDDGDGRLQLAVEALCLISRLRAYAVASHYDHSVLSRDNISRLAEVFNELRALADRKDAEGTRRLAEIDAQGAKSDG